MKQILLMFVAGGIGSLARFWLGNATQKFVGSGFPVGTLVVNLTGCLIFGFLWGLAEHRQLITDETRVILLVGFVGAFTTFSTFAFETHMLLRHAAWLAVAANLIGQVVIGILAVRGGIALARLV